MDSRRSERRKTANQSSGERKPKWAGGQTATVQWRRQRRLQLSEHWKRWNIHWQWIQHQQLQRLQQWQWINFQRNTNGFNNGSNGGGPSFPGGGRGGGGAAYNSSGNGGNGGGSSSLGGGRGGAAYNSSGPGPGTSNELNNTRGPTANSNNNSSDRTSNSNSYNLHNNGNGHGQQNNFGNGYQNNDARNNSYGPATTNEHINGNGLRHANDYGNGYRNGNNLLPPSQRSGWQPEHGGRNNTGYENDGGGGGGNNRPWQDTGARPRDGGGNYNWPENNSTRDQDRPMAPTAPTQVVDRTSTFINEERQLRERLDSNKRQRSGSGEEAPETRRQRQ